MNAWIEWANGVAGSWAEVLVRASWQGGLALVVVWGLCRVMRSGRGQSWLWRVGYAKFLVCLVWVMPLVLPLLPPSSPPPLPPLQAVARDAGITDVTAPSAEARRELPETSAVAAPVRIAAMPWLTLEVWAMMLWSVGVMVCLGRLTRAWGQTRRLRRETKPAEVGPACRELAAAMGLRWVPEVRAAAGMGSPLLVGVRRPVIVVPARMLVGCSPERMRLILAHELAHVKRRDLLWNWLEALVGALFFFHPLVWLARRPWRLAAEMACDEVALGVTGVNRAEYGRTLLEIVAGQRVPRGVILGVGITESAGNIRRRLVAMKNMTRWSRRRVGMLAAAVGVLALVGLLPWRVVAQQAAPTAAANEPGPSITPATERATARQDVAQQRDAIARFLLDAGKRSHAAVKSITPKSDTPEHGLRYVASVQGDTEAIQRLLDEWESADAPAQLEGVEIRVPKLGENNLDAQLRLVTMGAAPLHAAACWRDVTGLVQPTGELLKLESLSIGADGACVLTGHGARDAVMRLTNSMSAHMRFYNVNVKFAFDAVAGEVSYKYEVTFNYAPANASATTRSAVRDGTPARATTAIAPPNMSFIGTVGATIAEIRAPVDGVVANVAVKEGQEVKKGALLFNFDTRQAQEEVDVARGRVELAKFQLAAVEARVKTATVIDEDLHARQIQVSAEQTILEGKQKDLEALSVVAPFDGVLTTCDITAGEFVTRGTVLTQVVMMKPLRVDFRVTQDQIDRVHVGQKVTIQYAPGGSVAGEITYIAPMLESTSRTVGVRGTITGNTDRLKPGMYVNIQIGGD